MTASSLQSVAANASQVASTASTSGIVLGLADWLTIAFGLIGLAGTIYGFLAWREGEKQKKRFEYLFKLADLNIDKNVTEAHLAERRKAIEDASARIDALQEQIRKDIPVAAKRAVLADRLRSEVDAMSQHFNLVKRLKGELAALGNPTEIPPDLLRAVEREIEPEYVLREKQSDRKTLLTVLTGASAVASAALPWEIGRFVSVALLLLSVPVLVSLFTITIRRRKHADPTKAAKLVALAWMGIGVSGLLSAAFFAMIAIFDQSSRADSTGFYVVSTIALILAIPGVGGVAMGARKLLALKQTRARGSDSPK